MGALCQKKHEARMPQTQRRQLRRARDAGRAAPRAFATDGKIGAAVTAIPGAMETATIEPNPGRHRRPDLPATSTGDTP
jgi:hypothetical protein